jgi:chromosome segregation ATPase
VIDVRAVAAAALLAQAAPTPSPAPAGSETPGQTGSPTAEPSARAAATEAEGRGSAGAQAGGGEPTPRATKTPPAGGKTASADEVAGLRRDLDALRKEVEELRTEAASARDAASELQEALTAEREKTDALAAQLEAVQAARGSEQEQANRSPGQRVALLEDALRGMDDALRRLAAGNADGVDAELAGIAARVAPARVEAQVFHASREAELTGAALSALDSAREALSRSDLYQARAAIGQAAIATRSAWGLAREAAVGAERRAGGS